MEFSFVNNTGETLLIRDFLRQISLPRNFIKAVKFNGGQFLINNQAVTVRNTICQDQVLTVVPPIEVGHETVPASHIPIDVVYEDRDVLIINKPDGCVSIPSLQNPDTSIANRVKGYYQRSNYENQVIHIVTRLDRDTSGLMLIAKHRLAHAYLDQQLQAGSVQRYYWGISQGQSWASHGMIDAPIARNPQSIISRMVHESGQRALTEYWLEEVLTQGTLMKFKLHTGRTHQIRVHLSHCQAPLVGDDLYGGAKDQWIQRQALHCGELEFKHPFKNNQVITLKQVLPTDMTQWINHHRER